jgi:hypothetical protein
MGETSLNKCFYRKDRIVFLVVKEFRKFKYPNLIYANLYAKDIKGC